MEGKGIIAIILSIVIVVAVAIFFTTKNLSNSPSQLEKCNTIQYNGESKPSIVFFSTKEKAESFATEFFKISPFDKNKNNFNFYYIDNFQPTCELYKGIALLCYSKDLLKIAGSCPNDYVVVIEDQPSNIRSSSYMNVISINSKNNANVFAHEFGHAFANLADEYVPANIPRGSKNCPTNCDIFEGLGECIEGCSDDSHFRSIDQGIMRTLSVNTFGAFNEVILVSKIKKMAGITGNAIQETRDCKNERYYLIEGTFENGEIKIASRSIAFGCVGENGAGPFTYNLTLVNNEPVKSGEFNPELIFTDEVNENELAGGPQNYLGIFILKIPIIENSNQIEIDNNGRKTIINLRDIGARPCTV